MSNMQCETIAVAVHDAVSTGGAVHTGGAVTKFSTVTSTTLLSAKQAFVNPLLTIKPARVRPAALGYTQIEVLLWSNQHAFGSYRYQQFYSAGIDDATLHMTELCDEESVTQFLADCGMDDKQTQAPVSPRGVAIFLTALEKLRSANGRSGESIPRPDWLVKLVPNMCIKTTSAASVVDSSVRSVAPGAASSSLAFSGPGGANLVVSGSASSHADDHQLNRLSSSLQPRHVIKKVSLDATKYPEPCKYFADAERSGERKHPGRANPPKKPARIVVEFLERTHADGGVEKDQKRAFECAVFIKSREGQQLHFAQEGMDEHPEGTRTKGKMESYSLLAHALFKDYKAQKGYRCQDLFLDALFDGAGVMSKLSHLKVLVTRVHGFGADGKCAAADRLQSWADDHVQRSSDRVRPDSRILKLHKMMETSSALLRDWLHMKLKAADKKHAKHTMKQCTPSELENYGLNAFAQVHHTTYSTRRIQSAAAEAQRRGTDTTACRKQHQQKAAGLTHSH